MPPPANGPTRATPPPSAVSPTHRDAYEDFWASLDSDLVRKVPELAHDEGDPGSGAAYEKFLDP
jgi:hypothetical protein